MNDRFFLDTNLLVYAIDPTDARKHGIAVDWVARSLRTGDGIVSFQVVQEWFHWVLRKSAKPLQPPLAEQLYRSLLEPMWRVDSSRDLIETALDLFENEGVSWWDSIIVAAALQGGCRTLLSEDLQHGRETRGMRIENPFRESKSK
jgi:predicted nucleic acid-binding protein